MSFTTPRTWSTGELVTATIMNTHVRDNLLALPRYGAHAAGLVNSGASAQDLWTVPIGGNVLLADGYSLSFYACGRFAGNGNSKTVAFKVGATTVVTVTTTSNGGDWQLSVEIMRTGASAGRAAARLTYGNAGATTDIASAALTSAWSGSISAIVNVDGDASNDIFLDVGRVMLVPLA